MQTPMNRIIFSPFPSPVPGGQAFTVSIPHRNGPTTYTIPKPDDGSVLTVQAPPSLGPSAPNTFSTSAGTPLPANPVPGTFSASGSLALNPSTNPPYDHLERHEVLTETPTAGPVKAEFAVPDVAEPRESVVESAKLRELTTEIMVVDPLASQRSKPRSRSNVRFAPAPAPESNRLEAETGAQEAPVPSCDHGSAVISELESVRSSRRLHDKISPRTIQTRSVSLRLGLAEPKLRKPLLDPVASVLTHPSPYGSPRSIKLYGKPVHATWYLFAGAEITEPPPAPRGILLLAGDLFVQKFAPDVFLAWIRDEDNTGWVQVQSGYERKFEQASYYLKLTRDGKPSWISGRTYTSLRGDRT
ncbi:hypothetical protein B0H10DRAFT_2038781 [Mycena sp. CBHHK59/15]|nr:hypothetical protein B0H10DRAFT_2038781 [Mycena sp. CBHHK59/15]